MITAAHIVMYADDPEAARAFLKDTLELMHVDAGEGWLIFKLPPTEIAAHPTMNDKEPLESGDARCELYLMCDDLAAEMTRLRSRGVEFLSEASDEGWGVLSTLRIPGAGVIGLYEPRHPVAV